MLRKVIAASGALMVVIALPLAPSAVADDGQMIVTESGKVRCMVSADNVAFGGGPMVVCQPAAGGPFPQAPWAASKFDERLNLAVKRGAGQFNWQKGNLAASGQDIVLSTGQTSNLSGWTIESEETDTKFTYNATGKGMYLGIVTLRQF